MTTVQELELRTPRVLLGAGAVSAVPAELERWGVRRVFLVATGSSTSVADELAVGLGDRVVARFDRPVAHTPVTVTDDASSRLGDAEALVAVGGGSAIGLSKALSARTRLPQLVVPTTYAGSEVTPVLGETADGRKTTRRDPALLPRTVVYDPELTLSMPPHLTLTSAINALAHASEALWAPDASPPTSTLAGHVARTIREQLPLVLADPRSLPARTALQQSAWLAGICLAHTRMGLAHQLAHELGGVTGVSHADLHAVLLPRVLDVVLPGAPTARATLEDAFHDDPARAVHKLVSEHGGPTALRDLGVDPDVLPGVAASVVATPYPSPVPVERDLVHGLLERSWAG